jgi:uncharacterized protein YndB with AHSA1/START domain
MFAVWSVLPSPFHAEKKAGKAEVTMTEQRLPATRVVHIRRLLPATSEAVFEAWTDAESLKEWMCPGLTTVVTAELDVRVDGRCRIVIRTAEGNAVHTGEYREMRPPERLPCCANTTWDHLMHYLKAYAEGKTSTPYCTG